MACIAVYSTSFADTENIIIFLNEKTKREIKLGLRKCSKTRTVMSISFLSNPIKTEVLLIDSEKPGFPNSLCVPFSNDDKICRICCNEGKVSLFKDLLSKKIADHINECSEIMVSSTDGFPKWMCRCCLRLLKSAVKFRRLARESTSKLIQIKHEQDEKKFTGETTEPKSELVKLRLEDDIGDPPNELVKVNQEDDIGDRSPIPSPQPPSSPEGSRSDTSDLQQCPKCGEGFVRDKHTEHSKVCLKVKRRAKRRRLTKERDNERITIKDKKQQTERSSEKKDKKTNNYFQEQICETCGKSLSSIYKLITHRTVHMNVFPFKCDLCPYRGKTADLLRTHKRVHLAEKPYICSQCPSAFRTSSNLKKHAQTHKGNEEPVPCPQCDKSLRNKDSLRSHIKSVHAVFPAVCNICGKQFNTAKALSSHRSKVHNCRSDYTGRLPSYLLCQEGST